MVIREILDELSAIEKAVMAAIKTSTAMSGRYQQVQPAEASILELNRKLQSGLRRVTKTKDRIRACCQPLPIAAQYTPRPILRRAA